MVMKLEKVVPFGRSLDEYKSMFALADNALDTKIIGVGDGPTSFNAEMYALGKAIVSVDPLYIYRSDEIERRFYLVVNDIISQVIATPNDWVWSYHSSPEHLRNIREKVLHDFVADYEKGKTEGRYSVGELPSLDFEDNTFQLSLCSHLLFLYSEDLSYEFHLASVLEMLRVASEVRIFPLLTLRLERSPYVQPLIEKLKSEGFIVSIEKVEYELQRGGNEMLRIKQSN